MLCSKEKVLKTINFPKPDRIPVFDVFWKELIKKWCKQKGIGKKINICDCCQIDMAVPVADETFFPSAKKILKRENGSIIIRDRCRSYWK